MFKRRTGCRVAVPIAMAKGDGDDVFDACQKNGSPNPDSLSVNTPPECVGGAFLIEWNQEGAGRAIGNQ